MKEQIAALLKDRPSIIDFNLFEKAPEVDFVESYFNRFGELPSIAVFESETQTTLPQDTAPWEYYETKLRQDKFIRDAIPMLVGFNNQYEKDQEKALRELRKNLAGLTEPTAAARPLSVVQNTTRFETFKNASQTRILTGLKPFDEASGGLAIKDEFMLISARLGIGKSWVAHAIATNMCLAGYKVGLYSGEMSEDEVGARFDSLVSHISNYALTRGKSIDLSEHKATLSQIQGDLLVLTPNQIHRNARPSDLRTFAKENNLQCLFIDQLDLMDPDTARRGEEVEMRALLSYQLKTLQQELRIPIVAVSQLNRQAAQQEADASNIAGSDRFGRDATIILALSRKEDTLKIKVLKARSWRIPDQPWEFTWDIDKGILEPKLSGMDAVKAKIKRAKAIEQTASLEQNDEEEEESF